MNSWTPPGPAAPSDLPAAVEAIGGTPRAVAAWLLVCCALVFALIVVGGVTRLTHSGLSITEWQPIIGTLPPVSESQWSEAFAKYQATPPACFLDVFAQGITCSAADWKNWGTGADGLEFQKLEKECPAFAAEYAAVMIRVLGGSLGHYGPLRTKAAEVRPECDAMFKQVQTVVEQNPPLCASL